MSILTTLQLLAITPASVVVLLAGPVSAAGGGQAAPGEPVAATASEKAAVAVPPRKNVLYCGQFATLQACHDALPDSGGLLILPANTTYTLTSRWNITKPGVTVFGAGMGSTILRRDPGYTTGELMLASGAGFYITRVTFDGNAVSNDSGEVFLLGPHTVMDGVEIRNNARGALGCAAADLRIINSRFIGLASPTLGSMGIWFDNPYINGLVIANNVIKDQQLNGIFGSGKNILIQANYLSGNHRQVYPTGGGQITIKGLSTNANITIMGNTVEQGGGPVTSGLEVEGPEVSVLGNTIRGNGFFGVILQAGQNFQVVANWISNNGSLSHNEPGIYVNPGVNGFRITGNVVYDDQAVKTQSSGIELGVGAYNYVISGNDLRGNINPAGLNDGGTRTNGQIYGNLP